MIETKVSALCLAALVAGCTTLVDQVPGARAAKIALEAVEVAPEDIAASLALYCVQDKSDRSERCERVKEGAGRAGVGYQCLECPGDKPSPGCSTGAPGDGADVCRHLVIRLRLERLQRHAAPGYPGKLVTLYCRTAWGTVTQHPR